MNNYFQIYLKEKPVFLSLIRGKEAELFQKYLPLKKPVLDYGCGDGFFAKVVFGDNGKIDVGLDISKDVINEAKKSKTYKKTVLVKDGKFPFKKNHFNSIVSNCVLEHVVNLENDLNEIFRVLKPGGRFICTVMTNKWDGYLLGGIFLGNYYRTWMRKKQVHVQLPSLHEWEKLFKKVGFRIMIKEGYIDKKASRYLDLLHYLSAYTLVNKLLFNRWVIFPPIFDVIRVDKYLKKLADRKVSAQKSSAIFFVLSKNI